MQKVIVGAKLKYPKSNKLEYFFPRMCFIFLCFFKNACYYSNNFSVEGEVTLVKVRNVCINLGYDNLIEKIQAIIIIIVFQVKP